MYIRENEAFDEIFDEIHGDVVFGALTYSASQVLRAVDPIAYQMAVDEYMESLNEEEE